MPQMFPMSMLMLSMVVMGVLMICLVRLFWTVGYLSILVHAPSSLKPTDSHTHFW